VAQFDHALHGRILITAFGDDIDQGLRQPGIDGIVGKALADVQGILLEGAARHDREDGRADVG
jgi:hypothetical protein